MAVVMKNWCHSARPEFAMEKIPGFVWRDSVDFIREFVAGPPDRRWDLRLNHEILHANETQAL